MTVIQFRISNELKKFLLLLISFSFLHSVGNRSAHDQALYSPIQLLDRGQSILSERSFAQWTLHWNRHRKRRRLRAVNIGKKHSAFAAQFCWYDHALQCTLPRWSTESHSSPPWHERSTYYVLEASSFWWAKRESKGYRGEATSVSMISLSRSKGKLHHWRPTTCCCSKIVAATKQRSQLRRHFSLPKKREKNAHTHVINTGTCMPKSSLAISDSHTQIYVTTKLGK